MQVKDNFAGQILALWDFKEDPHPISHSCGSHQHHPGHPMHVVSEQHNSSNNTSSASSTTRLVRLEGHRENAGSVLGLAALPLSHTDSHTFHVDDTLADNFEPSLSTVQLDSFFQLVVLMLQSGQFCQFCRNPSALTTSVRLKRGKSKSLSFLLVLHYNYTYYKLKSQIQRIYAVQIKMPGCPSSWLANRASGTLSGHHHLSLRRCWSLNIVDTKHPPHSCQFIVKPSSCDIAGNHLICPPIASES